MDRDQSDLRLLSILHYVLAWIVGLFALMTLLLAVSALFGGTAWFGNQGPDSRMAGWFFAACAVLLGVGAFKLRDVAQSLAAQRRYGYCLTFAAIESIFFLPPVGTIIGVLTIILLLRPSIRMRFDQGDGSPG